MNTQSNLTFLTFALVITLGGSGLLMSQEKLDTPAPLRIPAPPEPLSAGPPPSVGAPDSPMKDVLQSAEVGRRGMPNLMRREFDTGDIAWVAAAAIGSLCLVPGIAHIYLGGTRSGMELLWGKIWIAGAAAGVMWLMWIYSLSFGPNIGTGSLAAVTGRPNEGYPVIGNTTYVLMQGIRSEYTGVGHQYSERQRADRIPQHIFVVVHLVVFVSSCVALTAVLGSRMNIPAMLVFLALWGTCVYAPITNWIWGFGWLRSRGVLDSAGGLAIHLPLGITAWLAGWLVPGRQQAVADSSSDEGKSFQRAFLYLIGAIAFQAATSFGATAGVTATFLNGVIAACCGVIGWTSCAWLRGKSCPPNEVPLGAVAGLVVMAAPAGYVAASSAILIGVTGGFVCRLVYSIAEPTTGAAIHRLAAIHITGGVAGSIHAAIFLTAAVAVTPRGEAIHGLLGGNPGPLALQIVAILAVGGWAAIGTLLIAGILRFVYPSGFPALEIKAEAP